jgi:hypothetical protein
MTEPNPAVPEVKPVDPAASTPPGGVPPATPPPEANKPGEPAPGAKPPEEKPPVGQPGVPPTSAPKEVPITALHEERDKRQSLEAEVAGLRQEMAASRNQQQQPQQQPQQDSRKELEELWEEDPKKAVRMEIMYAMDWRDRIDSGLESQADELARKYPDFNTYRSTALGQVRSLPLNQRGGQGILEASYFMVRGQNTDQIVKDQEAELLEKYRRGEISVQGLATPPGSFSTPAPVAGVAATQEQINVAGVMGMTIDEYMSNQQVPK